MIDSGDAAAINEAMVAAVESELGQRYTTGAKVPGVTTAGKSGTAELGGRGEPHSWFIGFAPAEAPRVAIAVLVEQAGRGAEVAAPMAGNLMELWLEYLGMTDPSRPRGPRPARASVPLIERIGMAADRRGPRRAVRRRRGRGVGRWRALPRGHGRDRLPDDGVGRRPDAVPRLMSDASAAAIASR